MRVIFQTNSNITGDGFSFQVFPSCDTLLLVGAEIQTLAGPSWDAFRGQKFNCSYTFLAPDDHHQVVVSVRTRGRPWALYACSRSYFEAYRRGNGDGVVEESIGKLCPEFEVKGNGRVRLHYVSQLSRWFEMQYQLIQCGGNYSKSFTLRPPQNEDSGEYAHNTVCEWRVTAPPQHAVVIEFKYFDMEICGFDSLTIYRGHVASEEQRTDLLCGNVTNPATIMVNSNEALIVLSTDSSNSYRGFLASVRFTPNCNEHVALDLEVPRMSVMRQYAVNISEPLLCIFQASAPPDYRISLEVRKLQLNDIVCRTCSYLEIHDSNEVEGQNLGRYFGGINGNEPSNRTKVFSSFWDMSFKLSANTRQAQRNISFELILQMERTVCGQGEYDLGLNETITLGMQYDNSTRFYEGSIQCLWIIKNKGDVELDFRKLRLKEISQRTGKCTDYIKLSKPYFSRSYCGQHDKSFKIVEAVNESNLQLDFHSDGLEESQGFEVIIRRKSKCNRNYTEPSQVIVTGNHTNCTDYIRVPRGYSITLYVMIVLFDSFDNNYFRVIDVQSNRTIYTNSDIQWETKALITSTNELRLESRRVSSLKFFYFSTSNQFPGGCGGDLAVGGSVGSYLENPSYEGRNSSLCTWKISVPAGGSLRFSFAEFNMGSESNCDLDNVRFYDSVVDDQRLVKKICGSRISDMFTIPKNNVIIVAKKSQNFDGLGFRMYIKEIG
ncbi:GM24708 [Drosophila sechellia]|uniref:GM24708 n=2 Tax=Drosophila sechellia TaxID=7238 RepID=B4HEZ4_DROSE|nr:GM24708 [Drosophila sechellia]